MKKIRGTYRTRLSLEDHTRASDNILKPPYLELIGTGRNTYLWIGTERCFACSSRLKTLRNAIDRHLQGRSR